jgi:hypothetical protein
MKMNKETKNKIEILKKLDLEKKYGDIYYLQGNDQDLNYRDYVDYWDILIFYYQDDHGDHREILPVPLIPKKLKARIQKLVLQEKIFLASRNWFNAYQYERDIIAEKYLRPTSYYPPPDDPFEEE